MRRANQTREQVKKILENHRGLLTCAEILRKMTGTKPSSATLSSLLYRMYRDGELLRWRVGPRGGHGYTPSRRSFYVDCLVT